MLFQINGISSYHISSGFNIVIFLTMSQYFPFPGSLAHNASELELITIVYQG